MSMLPKSNGEAEVKPFSQICRKQKIAAFVLVLLGSSTLCFANSLTDYVHGLSAPDGIYIPNPTHQFAKDESQEGTYRHTFRIYNLRLRVLRIEAQPDCGCTGLSWEKAEIAPFGWKELTGKMRATSAKSSSVAITLRTDSSDKKWAFLFLKS